MGTRTKMKEANFATLAEIFPDLEKAEFGKPAEGDPAAWRDQLIDIVGTSRLQREEVGMHLVEGKKYYKKERVWLRLKEFVANAAGYRSPRSIDNLMEDARRARALREVSPERYKALERFGIIAAETRWARLIEQLTTETSETETTEEARNAVERLYKAFDGKNAKGDPDGSDIELLNEQVELLKKKIERLAIRLFRLLPKEQRVPAIQQIVTKAAQQTENAEEQKSEVTSDPVQQSVSSNPVLNGLKAGTNKSTESARPNSSATDVRLQAAAHPWGDASLGSIVPGDGDFGRWEINSRALRRPESDRHARRFLVDDIFAECFTDYIASQHIKLFQKTPWHTYLVVSSNTRRLIQTSERTAALQWPVNAWIGTLITSTSAFDQIETLGALATPNKWVSFLPFKSGRPIRESSPALEEILRKAGIRWVVFGGDQINGWEITEDDEEEIARASHAAGCPVYCTSSQTLNDMLASGKVDPRSVPGIGRNGTLPRETWKLRELPDFNQASLGLSA